ncbi:MAG: MATE family efflux transporter [Ruminococcaceae bacterium]|nr:MATE family efflux transporter [Oscillospiraceae bacterium]
MTRDMTTGSPIRQILIFCVPLLIGNLFQQFYNLADSIIVGRMLGTDAFAAVGSTGSLNFLVLGFALGVCSGFTIPISQSFGAGDMAAVRRRCGQTVWLCLMTTALITGITFFTTGWILRITNTPPSLYDDAYTYIFIIFMGTGALVLYNMAASILRALGDSRTPLYFLIAATVINIVLDIVFMGPMDMGVEGAAFATVIAQLFSGLACLVYMDRKVPLLRLTRQDLRPDWREMLHIAGVGIPMGLQFSITAIGSVTLQSAVNSLGDLAVAGVSAGSKVHNVLAAPFETMGLAMATYCGQNLGAGRIDRIRKGVRQIMWVGLVYCAVALAAAYFFGPTMALLFIEAGETEVLALAQRFLMILVIAYPTLLVILVFRNGLQGMGFSNSAMLAGLAELVGRVAAAFTLVELWGYSGSVLAHVLAWILADLVLLPLYFYKTGRLERQQQLFHALHTEAKYE